MSLMALRNIPEVSESPAVLNSEGGKLRASGRWATGSPAMCETGGGYADKRGEKLLPCSSAAPLLHIIHLKWLLCPGEPSGHLMSPLAILDERDTCCKEDWQQEGIGRH